MDLSKIVWGHPGSPASSSKSLPSTVPDIEAEGGVLTPALRKRFFKMLHGKRFGRLAKYYPLPVDEAEIEVGCFELLHEDPAPYRATENG